jgi:cytochrome c556
MGRCVRVLSLLLPFTPLAGAPAFSQANLLDQRQKLMEQNQNGLRSLRPMIQGQRAVDQKTVITVLQNWNENAKKIPTLFPDETLGIKDTDALPAIKDRRKEFNALASKLDEDARAAQAKTFTADNIRAEITRAGQACNQCHDSFRKKK